MAQLKHSGAMVATPSHDLETDSIISAVNSLNLKVTPADVATKTGLPILVVEQKLNKIVSETKGQLEVTGAGQIQYVFSPGFQNAYAMQGILAVLNTTSASILKVLFYLVRISFGLALLLSLICIVVLFMPFALYFKAMGGWSNIKRDENSAHTRSSPVILDFDLQKIFKSEDWTWDSVSDLFAWNFAPAKSSGSDASNSHNTSSDLEKRERRRSHFLVNCFSLLFGDGDPNIHLEEKRWQLIAQMINKNGNAIIAEQLDPYMGNDYKKGDEAILPVLVRFFGKPEVTASGNIVYTFPSLQISASDLAFDVPETLEELTCKFTNASESEMVPVYLATGLNIVGTLLLSRFVLRDHICYDSLAPLVTVMCYYASLLLNLPILRAFWVGFQNYLIKERNAQRQKSVLQISEANPTLTKKLSEATDFQIKSHSLEQDKFIYTTKKDLWLQEE